MGRKSSKQITDIKLGKSRPYANSLGDTWDPTWADDGDLYFPGNDGSGWDQGCSGNVFLNRASGDDYFNLDGQTLNGMDDYGRWSEEGPDGCTWKSSGCVSVDGILYLAVARHQYGTKSGDPSKRQTVVRASIIKSSDHGFTWTRPAEENYHVPMFPGSRFSTPYFIHYGKDGEAPVVDQANRYIYAISNNGFWCNGDNYILGRVERSKIGRLNASDWGFYKGGDGMLDVNWSGQLEEATLIIDNPLKCGETGATYIPALGRYILVAWYYPGNPNVDSDETHFIYYEAPKPWGPWNMVKEDVIQPEGWYCPRVLSKWQKRSQNEVEAVLVTGGDYYEMSKYYRFTVVTLKLKTDGKFPKPSPKPEPIVVQNKDTGNGIHQFQYHGSWMYNGTREKATAGGEYYSDKPGDFFTIQFTGERLKWYTSKENNLGMAAVTLDGGEETLVDLYTYCVVPLYRRLIYDSGTLEKGSHTFQVRTTGQKNEKSTGIRIFNDRIEIF